MLILPSMYQSTIFGTSVRPRAPPNAVPFHTRPVTSWNGRVLDLLPGAGDADDHRHAPAAMAALERLAHQRRRCRCTRSCSRRRRRSARPGARRGRRRPPSDSRSASCRTCAPAPRAPGLRSTPTIMLAPTIRAPWTTLRPMPPRPNTTTLAPGLDLRRVDHGADAGRHAAADVADLVERRVLADLRERDLRQHRVVRERRAAHVVVDRLAAAARSGWCRRASRPCPASRGSPCTGWSCATGTTCTAGTRACRAESRDRPSSALVTPGPTSTTTPAPSWPRIAGNRPSGSAPERVNSSVWQMPVALISTSTSPAFGTVELHGLDHQRRSGRMRNRCTNIHALLLLFVGPGARSCAADAVRPPSYMAVGAGAVEVSTIAVRFRACRTSRTGTACESATAIARSGCYHPQRPSPRVRMRQAPDHSKPRAGVPAAPRHGAGDPRPGAPEPAATARESFDERR